MRRIAVGTTLATLALVGCGSEEADTLADDPPIVSQPTTTVAPATSDATSPDSVPNPDALPRLEEVASGTAPISLAFRPGGGEPYLAERGGTVVRFGIGFANSGEASTVLDISDQVGNYEGEQGLLGIAFSPDGEHLVANFTTEATDGSTTVSIFEVSEDGDVDDQSERVLLRVDQPYQNHNGGSVAFGPDGMLYIGFGDGGSSNDPEENGQDTNTILGSLVRIDPFGGSDDSPYGIPSDNPYAQGGGLPEIGAIGLRNPWRFSFDRASGDLWLADVGQNAFEEINRVALGDVAGSNFGWPQMEATTQTGDEPSPEGAITPVYEYGRSDGGSITGGYVYRGAAIPSMVSSYVYSDFISGGVNLLNMDGGDATVSSIDTDNGVTSVVSFGEDLDGELYVVSLEGPIFKIVPDRA